MVLDLNQPVAGKTYSLYGNGVSTHPFYGTVESLIDQILGEEGLSPTQLLVRIRHADRKGFRITRNTTIKRSRERLQRTLGLLHGSLAEYTTGIEEHLRDLPYRKLFTDRELFTSREQYYLYMIEFALVNRIQREAFLGTGFRIALLPYCLRETQAQCKAAPDQIDFRCRNCRKGCYINHVSGILLSHGVEPYIWRRSRLKPLLKGLAREHGKVGVLGIACIVELVAGMRRCMDAGVPVVGIPLNANRCPRWMGSFHDTSVDLGALEELLSSSLSMKRLHLV